MKKMFRRSLAAVMAVASLAVGVVGMNTSAYNNSASMEIRDVSGAPGNKTSGTLTIKKASDNNYYTEYSCSSYSNAAYLTVTGTNLYNIYTGGAPTTDIVPSSWLNYAAIGGTTSYDYATFSAKLYNSSGTAGVWYVNNYDASIVMGIEQEM